MGWAAEGGGERESRLVYCIRKDEAAKRTAGEIVAATLAANGKPQPPEGVHATH